jgi:hyperosmotically inducible periplasmic protein
MKKTRNNASTLAFGIAVVITVLALPQFSEAVTNQGSVNTLAENSNPVTTAASTKLDRKQYREVKVSAEKRVGKASGVSAVRNLIEVAGPKIADGDLQAKLQEKLSYDRVGYGNTFNAISLKVESGVVTLGGRARTDVDKDSALALVSIQPGVKDVIEEIEVDPVSTMDDQTRMAVARAIYGHPPLSRYAIDPAKPIRISVQNGHVELYGIVDSRADKDIAFIRANGVPGIFSVKNYLHVAGQSNENRE